MATKTSLGLSTAALNPNNQSLPVVTLADLFQASQAGTPFVGNTGPTLHAIIRGCWIGR